MYLHFLGIIKNHEPLNTGVMAVTVISSITSILLMSHDLHIIRLAVSFSKIQFERL